MASPSSCNSNRLSPGLSTTTGGIAGPRCLGLFDGGDAERDVDLVADEDVAAAECLVELHVEVAADQAADHLQTDPLVAPRVYVGALDDRLKAHVLRDSMHG